FEPYWTGKTPLSIHGIPPSSSVKSGASHGMSWTTQGLPSKIVNQPHAPHSSRGLSPCRSRIGALSVERIAFCRPQGRLDAHLRHALRPAVHARGPAYTRDLEI